MLADALSRFDVTTAGVADTGPVRALGYDATEPKGRRKSISGATTSEDRVLYPAARHKLTGTARDIRRNFSIAAWMVRKHLDYVSRFEFQARTADGGLNADLERLMDDWQRPAACDAGGRHHFPRLLRIAEGCRTVDGDVGMLLLADGRLQGIESDRIRQPSLIEPNLMQGFDSEDRWIHGVKIDRSGRALAYAIHRRGRGGSGFLFERTVAASNMALHGFFDRFDQIRGISPIASALNGLRDVYESFDYALAKAKVSQLFALAFFRDATESVEETEADSERGAGYQIDFGRGPIQLDLDPGDRAEFMESKTPSTEFQQFTTLVLQSVLKSLDIPYSFYDESHTNFFGSRAAWMHYNESCKAKRGDIVELLRRITLWRLRLWIADGTLRLPRSVSLRQLAWEWIPAGMPWWDPSKELNGDLLAIRGGLDTPQRITRERGRGDYYENIDRIAEALDYARQKGVAVSFDPFAFETPVPAGGEDA